MTKAELQRRVDEALRRMAAPGACTRCSGSGYRDDLEFWVDIPKAGGKVCFRCEGSGKEKQRTTPPLRVRAAVIHKLDDAIREGREAQRKYRMRREDAFYNALRILQLAAEIGDADPYLPVLEDVYLRAAKAIGLEV